MICNSEMVRDEIAARFGTPAEKLELIRNAVDSAHFHPGLRGEMRDAVRQQLAIPGDANVVAARGLGVRAQGRRERCCARARASAAAKPWAHRRRARQARGALRGARAHASASTRACASWARCPTCARITRPRDSFVLATLYDPFPNAALEAMASGLPVVTTPQLRREPR